MQKQHATEWLTTEYAAGHDARIAGLPFSHEASEPWTIGWADADSAQLQKAHLSQSEVDYNYRRETSRLRAFSAKKESSTSRPKSPARNITISRRIARFIPPGRLTFDEYFAKCVGLDLTK